MAEIGWIDFSNADRKKMSLALSAIRPEGQLDELGVGQIRDELADELFPGISTIQTRAKYFFIIPYILRDYYYLPAKERRNTTAARYLATCEHDIKNRLRKKYFGERNTGIIGITLNNDRHSVRQPSEIYWVGLNTVGCVRAEGLTLPSFLKNLDQHNQAFAGSRKEKEEDDDTDAGLDDNDKMIPVPATPNNWKDHIDIRLTTDEAKFLEQALRYPVHPKLFRTALHELFQNNQMALTLTDSESFSEFARKAIRIPTLSTELRARITKAHDFAYAIHGAHIFYNHLLQRHFFPQDYTDKFLYDWQSWYDSLSTEMIDVTSYQPRSLTSRNSDSCIFAIRWWDLVTANTGPDFRKMEQLIASRESVAKTNKARLRSTLNKFSEVKLNEWIGLKLLQYRFVQAKRIVWDILNPAPHA